jgi:hypothetical protein
LNIFGLRFPALPFSIFFFLKKKKEKKKIFQRIFIYDNERWGGEDKKKHVSKRNKERKRACAI